ncbi:MAG TPA: hypothetical protein VM221_04425 [Armatimonadota bacterium]|nr:hypothetical protein [Armatimonadota bacterium]
MSKLWARRAMTWATGLLALALLVGAVPKPLTALGPAQAGFFAKAKEKKAPPSADSAKHSDSNKSDSGGFFKQVKAKQPPPPPEAAPKPGHRPGSGGGLFEHAQPGTESPVMAPAGPPRDSPAASAWKGDGALLDGIKSPLRPGWSSRGYFEQLRRERELRRRDAPDFHYWYYPYDLGFYLWLHYHDCPWYIWPYYYGHTYPGYFYYYAPPPVVIVTESDRWASGETYLPYVSWPCESLMEAKRDIEQAWLQERIELLDTHLDSEHTIASYFRDEYTHGLSADEFRQLTADAFASIRTVSFDLTSVRYVGTADWARLTGKHVFDDPYDQRTMVSVGYLLRRVEREGGCARWVIWEVRQSPYAS